MASKDLSKVAPRKYGAHSGLKFQFNLNKVSIKKSTINVESRTEKKPPLPENEKHPGLEINLEREQKKKSATNQSKIEKEKQPPREDEGPLLVKFNLQRDSNKNSATSESKIEKGKPLSTEDGLKIKVEKDSKKSAIMERKTNKEKAPLPECEGLAGLKINLEGNSKKKSATNQSNIEKEKQPPRKYGAHSGLKFKFDTKKIGTKQLFIFESSTADTKRYSDAKKLGTVTVETFESQAHKEHHNPGVEKYASTLKEREKTFRESESFYDVIVEENVQDDFEILSKKEIAKLCSNSVASSHDLEHQNKSLKVTKSHAGDTLKPPEIASTASNLPSLNVQQISKGCPPVSKEYKVYETRFSDAPRVCTIAMKVADNQMHQEERHKSGVKKYESDLEEEDVQTLPDIESFYEVKENVQDYYEIKPFDATQIDDFVPIKKTRHKSGTKISIENESEDLCSRVATSLRVLQPQLQALKISKPEVSDTSKPQTIGCKTSKLPMLNVLQNSRGQPTKLEKPMTPASPRKYGFHAGLRFPFKEKRAIPVYINFNRTPSFQKEKCFKNEKRDPAS